MEKIFLLSPMALVLCASSAAFAATSGDGQVNFTGEIIDSACQVINDTKSPLNVQLGKISSSAFSGEGSTAATTQFNIQLTDCPDTVTSASITFGGQPDSDNNSVLALTTGTGVASGVGIQLLDSSDQPLSLYTQSAPYSLASGTSINDLKFAARYIQTKPTITAGAANSVSTFTVVYN